MNKFILLFLLLMSFITPAWANDSVEAAATGNIVFEKAPELIIQDETLKISKFASKTIDAENFSVDVDFYFKNISDHDVTRKIAFVLPPVECRMDNNSMWRGLDANDSNQMFNKGLKDFITIVDDRPQKITIRTEAKLGERNITDLLNKLNIPLNPCKIQMTMDNKPEKKYRHDLEKNHLLAETNEPAWSENIYFEWTQTFPAGKVIHIHHHYTPVLGASVLSPRALIDLNNQFTQNTPALTPIWNRNPEKLAEVQPSLIAKDVETNEERLCVMPKWVRYHLTSGANWNGGIGHFKLIIKDEDGAPFAVNEFYKNASDVHVTKENYMMTFNIKNFIPTDNLYVLFLILPKSAEELKMCGIQ